jgi:hypothetical protein
MLGDKVIVPNSIKDDEANTLFPQSWPMAGTSLFGPVVGWVCYWAAAVVAALQGAVVVSGLRALGAACLDL